MTSLKERIEAKKRRTASFPLQVGNFAAAAAQVSTARAALDIYQQTLRARSQEEGAKPTEAEAKRLLVLRGALKEARARQDETSVDVELVALRADEWEAIASTAARDEEGDIDLEDVLGALLAASCTDPDLQDADWWTEQLDRDEFSRGDRLSVVNTLISLNLRTPTGGQGNG